MDIIDMMIDMMIDMIIGNMTDITMEAEIEDMMISGIDTTEKTETIGRIMKIICRMPERISLMIIKSLNRMKVISIRIVCI